MKELLLGRIHKVQVSDDDVQRCLKFIWYPQICNEELVFIARDEEFERRITLHRFIVSAKTHHAVLFRDGNRLNCQRENLESVSRSVLAKRKQPKKVRNATGFIGVNYVAERDAYVAQCRGRTLGYRNTPEEAAALYDEAARNEWGQDVRTNFPIPVRIPEINHIDNSSTASI